MNEETWKDITEKPAVGDWIVVYAEEEGWHPNKLPPLITTIRYHKDAGFCCCDIRKVKYWKPAFPKEDPPDYTCIACDYFGDNFGQEYCSNCGEDLPDDSDDVCPHCGVGSLFFEESCPVCGDRESFGVWETHPDKHETPWGEGES